MAVAGCPEPISGHLPILVRCAVDMLKAAHEFNRSNSLGIQIKVRIGINSGCVVAGVIGKTKVMYSIFLFISLFSFFKQIFKGMTCGEAQ